MRGQDRDREIARLRCESHEVLVQNVDGVVTQVVEVGKAGTSGARADASGSRGRDAGALHGAACGGEEGAGGARRSATLGAACLR
jgi:hypothetical protein